MGEYRRGSGDVMGFDLIFVNGIIVSHLLTFFLLRPRCCVGIFCFEAEQFASALLWNLYNKMCQKCEKAVVS